MRYLVLFLALSLPADSLAAGAVVRVVRVHKPLKPRVKKPKVSKPRKTKP